MRHHQISRHHRTSGPHTAAEPHDAAWSADADGGTQAWGADVPVTLFALKIFTGSRPPAPTARPAALHTRTHRTEPAVRAERTVPQVRRSTGRAA